MPRIMAMRLQMEDAMNFPAKLDDIRVDFPSAPANVPKDRIVDLSFAMGGMPMTGGLLPWGQDGSRSAPS